MTIRIDRRSLVLTGTLGLGAYAVPGFARTPQLAGARGFSHGVASGEPAATSLLCWTRFVGSGDTARVTLQISTSADFARPVAAGEQVTGPWRDWTVKITPTGLNPGTRYHYRFVGPDGSFSPVGQGRTLPEGNVERFRIAVFSCSNIGFGYFNAYAHAAARGDIDLALHLGDYFYEYRNGTYPDRGETIDGRFPLPASEAISLADYRLRYASYRSDPDLQALHAAVPLIASWDDHESANDSWEGGAENHDPATEGAWSTRKAAAMQAWREWMPVSDAPWEAYSIGTLATLFRTETRLLARSRQPSFQSLAMAADPGQAIRAFRDGSWRDPAMTMMGSAQEAWIADEMARSVRAGVRWQLAGVGTVMGAMKAPGIAASWLKPDASALAQARVKAAVLLGSLGLPLNPDNWGGYPAARERFLDAAQRANANLIVLSGDSHNGWAFDLANRGMPAGVEFAGHAVTSTGFETAFAPDPRVIAATMVATNPELKWCDTSRRGYMALTLTPDTATNEWMFVDTVARRVPSAAVGHVATVARGRNAMA
ncbi:alkaline phosphatase D family protein [Sphingomonas sp.]|uniref:alkaline phosphatase D family protein n=1 Tax=Sphingomonas sp. TaxID=28214 RepID=UPI001EB3A4A0|nr:alkaline phosphatase D family protein [Sphingomonas sp.]MBX3593743.1 alkaline phosphatase D family protein [Sphingomonas sp.]